MAQDQNPEPNHTRVPELTDVRDKGLKQHLNQILNNLNMTQTATAKKTTLAKSGKQKNPKYRVHPGLSITGSQLRSRMKNNSIMIGSDGQYSLDEEITSTSRLSKTEVINKAYENEQKIITLQKNLEAAEKAKDKDRQAQIRKDLKELEELRNKNKNDPKP